MSNKTLSYEEYQERIKEITTPEEASAFAKEMLTPESSEVEENVIETTEVPSSTLG